MVQATMGFPWILTLLIVGTVLGQARPVSAGDEPIPLAAVYTACDQVKNGVKKVVVRGGTKYAGKWEVYGFEPEYIFAERCQELEITLIVEERVRHSFMTNNFNPMFMIEVAGSGQKTGSLVTPAEPGIINFHCHVPAHKTLGMSGAIIVGFGTERESPSQKGVIHVQEERKER